jgi:hypothetical protein
VVRSTIAVAAMSSPKISPQAENGLLLVTIRRPGRERWPGTSRLTRHIWPEVFGRQTDTNAIVAIAVEHPRDFGRI